MFPEVIKQALPTCPPTAAILLLDLSRLTPASICLTSGVSRSPSGTLRSNFSIIQDNTTYYFWKHPGYDYICQNARTLRD